MSSNVAGEKLVGAVENTSIWKIRAHDGTFSDGGSNINRRSFSKKGKIWKRPSDLTAHLAQLDERSLAEYDARGCTIVSYEMVPTGTINIPSWINDAEVRREKRNESKLAREDRVRKENILCEIELKLRELERLRESIERVYK